MDPGLKRGISRALPIYLVVTAAAPSLYLFRVHQGRGIQAFDVWMAGAIVAIMLVAGAFGVRKAARQLAATKPDSPHPP